MNIVFIDYFKPDDNNGICAYRKNMVRYLSGRREVNLILVSVLCSYRKDILVSKTDRLTKIDLPYDLAPNRHILKTDRDFVKILGECLKPHVPTVVHMNWMNHTFVVPILRQELPNCKIILTKHCVSWRENVVRNFNLYQNVESALKSPACKRADAFLRRMLCDEVTFFSIVDHVITVTHDARQVVTKLYGIPNSDVTTIYNGVNLPSDIKPDKPALREAYGFRPDDKIVLFVGGLFVFKGLHLLLPVIESLSKKEPNLKLVICGTGHFQDVMTMLPKSIAGKVTFMGNLPKEKLSEVYRLADIGVVPSLQEQCSYVALEMMQSGLPLLISDVPGLSELLPRNMPDCLLPMESKDGKLLLNEPIAEQRISRLLNDTAYRTECLRRISDNLAERFSADEMCEKTFLLYHIVTAPNFKPERYREPINKMISVVIPCYNSESTIADSVNSILSQEDVEQLEIIVVDDGSTDGSIEVLKSIKDSRLRILQNDKNLGVAESLNAGIRSAKGEYIARLDADDVMLPGRLYKQAKFLDEHPDYAMVGSNMFVADNDMNIISTICYPETDTEIRSARFFMNPFGHPSVMLRRNLFSEFAYESTYSHCEDYHLWLRILKTRKAHNLQEFLTAYRIADSSVSAKNTKAQHESAVELMVAEAEAAMGRELKTWESKILAAINIGAPAEFWTKHREELTHLIATLTPAASPFLQHCALSHRL